MHLVSFLAWLALASALQINYTIDDTLGDQRTGSLPRYMGSSGNPWVAAIASKGCLDCGAQPDGTLAYNGTWHDRTTFSNDPPASISIDFSGSKIYIFCILANNVGLTWQDTRLSFYLDGGAKPVADFLHTPDMAVASFLYNQLVFESDSLTDGNHNLLVNNYASDGNGSLILFDYAIYTTEADQDPPTDAAPSSTSRSSIFNSSTRSGNSVPTASQEQAPPANSTISNASSLNVGAVVGGALGGAVMFLLLLVAGWFLARRKKRPSAATLGHAMPHGDSMRIAGEAAAFLPPEAQIAPYPADLSSSGNSRDKGSQLYRHDKYPSAVAQPSDSGSASAPSASAGGREEYLLGELDSVRHELAALRQSVVPPRYVP